MEYTNMIQPGNVRGLEATLSSGVSKLINEGGILSNSNVAVQHYGLIEYGSKIDAFYDDMSGLRESLTDEDKIEVNNYIKSVVDDNISGQHKGLMIGGLCGFVAGVGLTFLDKIGSIEPENLICGAIAVGGLIGVGLAKKHSYQVLSNVKTFLNSDNNLGEVGSMHNYKNN